MDSHKLPYWNVNLPPEEWTEACPVYLEGVDHWDRAQLATKDQDYRLMTWTEVRAIIRE